MITHEEPRSSTRDTTDLGIADVASLASNPATRLALLLVRCGGCRFLAPAQDVERLIDAITKDGRDYVRDISVSSDAPSDGAMSQTGSQKLETIGRLALIAHELGARALAQDDFNNEAESDALGVCAAETRGVAGTY